MLRKTHTHRHCCLAFGPLLGPLKAQELKSLMVERQRQIQAYSTQLLFSAVSS